MADINQVENDENFYMASVNRIESCDIDSYAIYCKFSDVTEYIKSVARSFSIFCVNDISIIGVNSKIMHKYSVPDSFFININHSKINDQLKNLCEEHFVKKKLHGNLITITEQ
jgi:hypothetical protein